MLAAREEMPEKIESTHAVIFNQNYRKTFCEYPASGSCAVAEHCLNILRLRV